MEKSYWKILVGFAMVAAGLAGYFWFSGGSGIKDNLAEISLDSSSAPSSSVDSTSLDPVSPPDGGADLALISKNSRKKAKRTRKSSGKVKSNPVPSGDAAQAPEAAPVGLQSEPPQPQLGVAQANDSEPLETANETSPPASPAPTSTAVAASAGPSQASSSQTANSPGDVPVVASAAPTSLPPPPPAPSQSPPSGIPSSPAGNSAASPAGSATHSTNAPIAVNHLVIVKIQLAGAARSNSYVKIFNPTAVAIDVGGWKLRKKSSTGREYSLRVFPKGSAIAPGGYFTWANSKDGFAQSIGANVSSTETLAANNSVALFDAAGGVIDAVAWGTGADQYVEGEPFPTDPAANQALARKSAGGAFVDTENNAADFMIQ